jgi:hypothetical protein
MYWHRHQWSKWVETERGSITRSSDDATTGYYLRQERECSLCGFKELDHIKRDIC